MADSDALESKSYTKVWFLLGGIILLTTLWSYWDEFFGRRTYKFYQMKFNRIERAMVEAEIKAAREALKAADAQKDDAAKSPTGDDAAKSPTEDALPGEGDEALSLRKIGLNIEEAEHALRGGEYRAAKTDVERKTILFDDAKQRYQFAKADQDEIFYRWKHAQESGAEFEDFKKDYYDLEERLQGLKEKMDSAETDFNSAQAKLDAFAEALKGWEKKREEILEPIVELERKLAGVKGRGFEIRQVVLQDLGKHGVVRWGNVDRCQTCHMAIDRAGFETQPNPYKTHPNLDVLLKNHPPEKYGCTTCHGGQGRATQIEGKPLHHGDHVHGIAEHWEEPLLRGDSLQSTCNKCHQDQWILPSAPTYIKGKRFFYERGCIGCHDIKGFENAPKAGPSLQRVAAKVYPEWLISWVKDPHQYLPHSKMPRPTFWNDEEPIEAAAYILAKSEPYDLPFGKYPGGGDPLAGRQLFKQIGCVACHSSAGSGGSFGPALDRIANKTHPDWVYNWLHSPKSYSHEARMPSLRLSDKEASDVTAFLMLNGTKPREDADLRAKLADPAAIEKGFLTISRVGCYGCHTISGFEKMAKLSVDLTGFGIKELSELDFGDTHVEHTWEGWTEGKLKDPQQYVTERTTSRMPNFKLSDEDIHALVVFLKGLKKETPPLEFQMNSYRPGQKAIDHGRHLVAQRNCVGCHLIEGEGGEVAQYLENPDLSPPNLNSQGAKTHPTWAFAFLKDPGSVRLRPWLDIRMPTFQFSDAEASTVVEYFAALDKQGISYTTPPAPEISAEHLAAAKALVDGNHFSCFSCHQQGEIKPSGPVSMWAPDLTLARRRLKKDWIKLWLQDPQKLMPGTKMPTFLADEYSGPEDVLGGDEQLQIEALADYIISLGE